MYIHKHMIIIILCEVNIFIQPNGTENANSFAKITRDSYDAVRLAKH